MQTTEQQAFINHLEKLVAIESTADKPGQLQVALEYVEQFVRERVPDITIEHFERNDKPSFLAYRGTKRPKRFRVLLNGHVDVVPGTTKQYHLDHEGDTLYGRGVYDMKAGALVLAEQFCAFVEHVPFELGLQISTDEESTGHDGALYQVEQGVRADLVVCGDCGRAPGTYTIANQAKGICIVRLTLTGRSSHGAYPWRSQNAALMAATFAANLQARFPQPTEPTGQTTITVTGLHAESGGISKVPDTATITVDCRYAAGDPNFSDKSQVLQLFSQIDPAVTLVEFVTYSSPMLARPGNVLLQQLKIAAETVEGQPFSFSTNNGTGDGRFYTAVGCDACEFGIPGEGQHSKTESITLDAIETYRKTIQLFLERCSSLTSFEGSES